MEYIPWGESMPALKRKHTVLEIGSKMVSSAQGLEIRIRFLPPLCTFNYKHFGCALFVMDREPCSSSATAAMERKETKLRLLCALQIREREISIGHSVGWQLFPLRVAFGAVVFALCPTDPWGFADCF